jgi:hypothetical protein
VKPPYNSDIWGFRIWHKNLGMDCVIRSNPINNTRAEQCVAILLNESESVGALGNGNKMAYHYTRAIMCLRYTQLLLVIVEVG